LTTIRGGRIGGDLPAFYGAGRILREGHGRQLYDPARQEAAQRDLLPEPGRLPFPYPPYVAAAYVPLTWLPFKAAYLVHVLLMAACVVGALAFLRGSLPAVREEFLPIAAVTLAFYPIFRAVLGGQNTPFSLLCAAGAAAALARGRDLTAGLWIGAWLFKPQLALPVAAFAVLRSADRVRFALGVAAIGTAYYLVGAAIGGLAWPIWWWRDGAMPFAAADLVIDRANGVSLPIAASALGVPPLGWIAALAVAAYALWFASRASAHPVARVAVAAAATVLCAPYALYYDAGLAALGLIVAGAARPSVLPWIGALWLLAWLQPVRALLPIPPLTVVLLASLVLAARAHLLR
jgi:Glycosyltransferase family 87